MPITWATALGPEGHVPRFSKTRLYALLAEGDALGMGNDEAFHLLCGAWQSRWFRHDEAVLAMPPHMAPEYWAYIGWGLRQGHLVYRGMEDTRATDHTQAVFAFTVTGMAVLRAASELSGGAP